MITKKIKLSRLTASDFRQMASRAQSLNAFWWEKRLISAPGACFPGGRTPEPPRRKLLRGLACTLILPKKHYGDVEEIEPETAYAIMDISKKLSIVLKSLFKPDGISICQNGGKFNDLAHYHIHLIPRYEGDGFTWSEPTHPHGAEKRLSQTKEKFLKVLREE